MSKILFNPIDEWGIPLFKEPQLIDPEDFPQYKDQFPKSAIKERTSKRKPRSDKGKSRGSYTKSGIRGAKRDAKALENTLKDIERFERKEAKADHSGSSKSRAEQRKEKRLQLIPNPRICPHCNKPKLLSKQWVITKSFVGCKGCHWRINILPNQQHCKETPHGIIGVSSNNSNQTLE